MSYSSCKNESVVSKLLHPSHSLRKVCFPNDEFTCNGCNSSGNGFRYQCPETTCNFNLHDFCRNSPPKLQSSFFMHPAHTLKLHTPRDITWYSRLFRSLSSRPNIPLCCELCEDQINPESQIFYTCKACGFHVHPLCSQLPAELNHSRHNTRGGDRHMLKLRKLEEDHRCAVCTHLCGRGSWRYSCDRQKQCETHIHITCITTDYPDHVSGVRNAFEILKTLGIAVLGILYPGMGLATNMLLNNVAAG